MIYIVFFFSITRIFGSLKIITHQILYRFMIYHHKLLLLILNYIYKKKHSFIYMFIKKFNPQYPILNHRF